MSRRQIHQSIVRETEIPGGREVELTFHASEHEPVPATMLIPASAQPAAAALLMHGFSSRREVMVGSIGRALFAKGIASMSVELPLHGTRADPLQTQSSRNPLAMMQLWRLALSEVRTGIHYLGARPDIDSGRIAMVGYSMGGYLSVAAAAEEPKVRAVVLAAAGDLPSGTPFASMARMVMDPARSVAKLAGRPLLMVHGRNDRTVTPALAQRLFDAAREPKKIVWYDAGHRLPEAASSVAAAWLLEQLG